LDCVVEDISVAGFTIAITPVFPSEFGTSLK
jgi:hypothetical protein